MNLLPIVISDPRRTNELCPDGAERHIHSMSCSNHCRHIQCARQLYRDKLLSFSGKSSKVSKSFTFRTTGQRYVGAIHGRGGRTLNGDIRDASYFKDATFSCLAKYLLQLQWNVNDFRKDFSPNTATLPLTDLTKKLQSFSSFLIPTARIQPLQHSIGFSTLYSSENNSFIYQNDYETQATKHALCTWVTKENKLLCTCVGFSSFRADFCHQNSSQSHCIHTHMIQSFFAALADSIPEYHNIGWVDMVNATRTAMLRENSEPSPNSRTLYQFHSNRLVILYMPSSFPPDVNVDICVPIRIARKGRMKYICCFCETSHVQSCEHVKAFLSITDTTAEEEMTTGTELLSMPSEETDHVGLSNTNGNSSYLPLGPISCIASVKLDEHVCSLAKKGSQFIVNCPSLCTFCNSNRDETTRQVIKNGIIHCSVGPCRMYLESFICANNSCKRRFIAEGRESYICIRNTTSAITHSFVRKECEAVALSAGTLRRRMELYLKQVTMSTLSGQLPRDVPSRSSKVLQSLCSLAVSLMVKDPNPEFFQCKYCDLYSTNSPSVQSRIRSVFAICIDGIRAGCSDVLSFQNSSPECHPIPANVRRLNEARPRNGLLRKQSVVTLLMLSLEGKPVKVTVRNIVTACETLKLLHPSFTMKSISLESICGRTPIDFSHDVGTTSTLSCIKNLLRSFFDTSAASIFLMKSMLACTTPYMRASADMALNPTKRDIIQEVHQYMLQNIPEDMQYQERNTFWNPSVNVLSNKCFSDITLLITALLSHSLPNFLTDDKSQSFTRLAQLFQVEQGDHLIERLVEFYKCQSSPSTNVLRWNRLLFDGLFSMIQCLPTTESQIHITNILRAVDICIKEFYSDNDILTERRKAVAGSAAEYHSNWNHITASTYQNSTGWNTADSLNTALRTGEFFPSLRRLRPHPFSEIDTATCKDYGPCSKDYSQKNNGFTHGAVTICCSCSNPIIYGFKVLQKVEGPQAILNILLSRFERQPKYIVYDFACGLQRVAMNSLWWSFRNSTFVSDAFHSVNHSCSRIFHPRSYKDLDICNTVSHEQRNRPIAELKKSFRSSKKTFYISLLAYHILMTNIHAQLRRDNLTLKAGRTLRFTTMKRLRFEHADLWYFQKGYKCTCCS